MKVTSFDRNVCQALRNELNAVLQKFGADANLEFTVGNMKFSDQSVEIKVAAKVIGGKSVADKNLEYASKAYGLSTEPRNGKRLVGYNSRSYKYPFVYLNLLDGKRYKCSEVAAKNYFAI